MQPGCLNVYLRNITQQFSFFEEREREKELVIILMIMKCILSLDMKYTKEKLKP